MVCAYSSDDFQVRYVGESAGMENFVCFLIKLALCSYATELFLYHVYTFCTNLYYDFCIL